jgi:hypothetical protein
MTVSASVVHVWPRLVNAAALVTVLVDGTSLGIPVPARTGLGADHPGRRAVLARVTKRREGRDRP